MKKIRVTKGTDERDIPLDHALVVGRDPQCDINDKDLELSRRHAEFVLRGQDIVVRDLNSRNGIRVNGVRVNEATLRPGDVVQVAKLRMKYVDDSLADDTQESVNEIEERTVMMPPPVAVPPASAAASKPVSVSEESPAAFDDKTMLLKPPLKNVPVVAAPQPGTASSVKPQPATPETTATPKAAARPKRIGSWGGRVLMQTLALAILVFLVIWVPMSIWQRRLMNETAAARASALAGWLASEASASLAAGSRNLPDVGARVAKEPGVVAYLIVSPKGEVWAPAARAREPITKLPGVGVAPSAILHQQTGWNGDLIEVALPVAVGDDPRVAVAALTFRPSTSSGGSTSGILLAPLLLATILLGWLFALALRRRTLAALARFNEDVDLLLAGQLTAVADPMGTKPTKDLANLVNHLVLRLKAGDSIGARRGAVDAVGQPLSADRPAREPGVAARPALPAQKASTPPAGAAPAGSAPARGPRCYMIASPTFRVVEASPSCADVLGLRPDAQVGQHVLDAVQDKAILDAILKCLSRLSAAGEERMMVAPEGRPFQLSMIVERSGKDQPITITFEPVDGERP